MKKIAFILCIGILSATFSLLIGASFAEAQLVAPTSPSPSDGATAEQPVILKWSSVEFPGGVAGGYLVEVAGGNLPSGRHWAPQNSFDFRDYFILAAGLTVNAEHRWRVRACFGFDKPSQGAEESTCGPWSNNGNIWKFFPTLAKPKLVSPSNTTREAAFLERDPQGNPSIKLQWEKVVGADRYSVMINKTAGTPFSLITCGNTSEDPLSKNIFCWIKPGLVFPNNFYTWQVTPFQGNKPGPVSDLWQFFTALAKPTLLTPKNGDPVPYPVSVPAFPFTWASVPGATGYILEVFEASNRKVEKKENIAQTAFSAPLTAITKIGEKYTWQVTACETGNKNCGPPSTRLNFTLIFAPPVITAPTQNQEVSLPLSFTWNKPSAPPTLGSVKYLWEIIGHKSGEKTDPSTSVTLNLTEQDVSLKPGSYTFRVKACTPDNRGCSGLSERKFEVPLPVSAVAPTDREPPSSVGPALEIVSQDPILFPWPEQTITPNTSTDRDPAVVLINRTDSPLKVSISVSGDGFKLLSRALATLTPQQQEFVRIGFTAPEKPSKTEYKGTVTVSSNLGFRSVDLLASVESPASPAIPIHDDFLISPKPTGIFGVVDRAVNVAFTALLIAASLFIMVAAFQFLTGGGNPEQIASAKDKLLWAGVGIIVALVSKGAAVILQTSLGLPSTKAGPGPCPDLGGPKDGIQNPLNTICVSGLLDSIINVIFTLSLIVVPFVVLYAGFLFVTGGGNPEQITRARNTLIWTFVGFIVILVAKGLPFILKEILEI